MKTAIVSGATGMVGSSTARYLSEQGVRVLCLGRQDLNPVDTENVFGHNTTYASLAMSDVATLPKVLDTLDWDTEHDCVFYHFAWSGLKKLTDGSLEMQLSNAVNTSNAVKVAKYVGCKKFVNVGTLEETFTETWMSKKSNTPYISSQTNYIISKLASRDLGKITAYLEKIDYIHTRLSVPLDFELNKGNYIASTLKKIINKEFWEKPLSNNLYDITSLADISRAYFLIGLGLQTKADYYIGASEPATLNHIFDHFERRVRGYKIEAQLTLDENVKSIFSTSELKQDIGFSPSSNFQEIPTTFEIS